MATKPGVNDLPGVGRIIQRLTEAKVINTNVMLQSTVDIVSSAEDPIDFWCGTIRRPWVIVRSSVDVVEEAQAEIAQAAAASANQ
jgi:hypothetical protein